MLRSQCALLVTFWLFVLILGPAVFCASPNNQRPSPTNDPEAKAWFDNLLHTDPKKHKEESRAYGQRKLANLQRGAERRRQLGIYFPEDSQYLPSSAKSGAPASGQTSTEVQSTAHKNKP